MEFLVLGPLEVRREGRPLVLPGSKRRTVLALLVLHANEVVRSERLIDELWGEHPPANASAALHNHVSRLRKDLGAEALVTKPWGYVLHCEPEAVDLRRFESLVAEAKPLAARERRERLAEALALWRGPALADLSREPALDVEIARLEELRLSALEQRIDADLELGAHEELVPELEALVGEHPLSERLRGQLILALYRSGRQAEALETYRETRRELVEELGIEPSPELRDLERAMLCQDPALAAAAAPAAAEVVETAHPHPPPPSPAPRRRRRSVLALGLGLLLLALAGGAAAMLATRDRLPGEARAAGGSGSQLPPPFTGSTSTKPVTATTRTATRKHSSHRGQSSKKSKPSAGPPPAPVPAISLVGHRPSRAHPAGRPSGRDHSRPSGAKPVLIDWVYWLTDDFTDPDVDAMWYRQGDGDGVSSVEQDGRLEFSIADTAVPPEAGVDAHYIALCDLRGDFDATVDYQLVTWPANDGLRMTMSVFIADKWLTVERSGGLADGSTPELYRSNLEPGADVRTSDSHGGLRLRRTRGLLRAYYRYRGRWIKLAAQLEAGPASLVLTFNTAGSAVAWGGKAAAAAFDNFDATAHDVKCFPGVPVPPRKRRH